MMPKAAAKKGFTLLEVLVALAILTLSLGVLYQSFGLGLDTTKRSVRELNASAVAESILDRLGKDLPLSIGEVSGEAPPDLQWRAVIAPYGSTDPGGGGVAAFTVALFITQEVGTGTREWRIDTIRIGAGTPE